MLGRRAGLSICYGDSTCAFEATSRLVGHLPSLCVGVDWGEAKQHNERLLACARRLQSAWLSTQTGTLRFWNMKIIFLRYTDPARKEPDAVQAAFECVKEVGRKDAAREYGCVAALSDM